MQGFIDSVHHLFIEMGDFVGQSLFIYCPDLLQQNDGVTIKSINFGINFHVRRQFCLLNLRRDGGDDDRRTESVSYVVLNHQYRPYASLLRADDRGKVREKHIATFDDHKSHPAN